MTREMIESSEWHVRRLLFLCARPTREAADTERIAREAAGFSAWEDLPAQAELHGMAPLVYSCLKAAAIRPPSGVQRQLQGLTLRHGRANQIRTEALRQILDAFESSSIHTVVLKGAAVSHVVYPEVALRPMSDLDLLVSASDAARAQGILFRLGFAAGRPASQAFLHRHLNIATAERQGLRVQVEIHHRLLTNYFDSLIAFVGARLSSSLSALRSGDVSATRALMARARPFSLMGGTAFALGHLDMLDHLCRHVRSHVNIWDFPRLIWFADVVGYAERFATEIDWAAVQVQAPGVLHLLALLHHTMPLSEELLSRAGITVGRVPAGLGVDYQGWPGLEPAGWRARGPGRALRETLFPSEWWLRLRYNLGTTRPLLLTRWLRHPFHILAQLARTLLERVGLPDALDLAGQRASIDSRAGDSHEP